MKKRHIFMLGAVLTLAISASIAPIFIPTYAVDEPPVETTTTEIVEPSFVEKILIDENAERKQTLTLITESVANLTITEFDADGDYVSFKENGTYKIENNVINFDYINGSGIKVRHIFNILDYDLGIIQYVDWCEVIPPVEEPTEPSEPDFDPEMYVDVEDEHEKVIMTLLTSSDYKFEFYDTGSHDICRGKYTNIDRIWGNRCVRLDTADNLEMLEHEGIKLPWTIYLLNNGTIAYEPPQIDNPNGNKVLDTINYVFQQAWFYLPLFFTILASIGIPALIKLVSIVGSQKLTERREKKTIKLVNKCAKRVNELQNVVDNTFTNEIAFLTDLKTNTINKKQVAVLESRIESLKENKDYVNSFDKIELIDENELTKKQLKKEIKQEKKVIKAKVVKGE